MFNMVISSFISSILVLALGIWAYMKLESSMNLFAEKQLLIEPSKFSYKMWKDMPVSMYQSFTFFNLTNWNQVKAIGQKPKFVEVGPYVYKTIWSKQDINFLDDDKLINFAEKKQWHFQAHLSRGYEDDQIWTINTPLMTALALIQNAPVITRNIVSVILDGLGEGAFIKRPIRSLLFEGYSDLIVSVGPLFDRRFANFNGKFAYLYNKNDTVDGIWTVSTGLDDLSTLNKIQRFQSSIVNMTSFSSGQQPQGLNEVKAECAPAWSLDQSTNGQLFAPLNRNIEQIKLQQQLAQLKARSRALAEHPASPTTRPTASESIVQAPKRFFSRSTSSSQHSQHDSQVNSNQQQGNNHIQQSHQQARIQDQLKEFGKFIFYPDLCRPIHLLPTSQEVTSDNGGIRASRYFIDPRVFMNSTQVPTNKCYEMNPRPPLANALAATINSVTGANVNVPKLVTGASSPFAMFIPPNNHHLHHNHHHDGLFERSNHHHPSSILNNALHSLGATANQAADQLAAAASNNAPVSRLGRVKQLFSNIVSQRMSAAGPLLPSLTGGPASLLMGNHYLSSNARNAPDLGPAPAVFGVNRQNAASPSSSNIPQDHLITTTAANLDNNLQASNAMAHQANSAPPVALMAGPQVTQTSQIQQPTGSDRWITQFRFKWPRGVFSIGQCQLGAPIYVSLPHFLDADEYYLEQVDGLKPNRSLHEFYIDVESTLHSIPVGLKARLQLNVATPELRFRNIPNAMIPVLWQEVTFKMDKPIATMLYWSFTMSSTIYKLVSILLILLGSTLFIFSFVGEFRRHNPCSRQSRRISDSPSDSHRGGRGSSSSSTRTGSTSSREHHHGHHRHHQYPADIPVKQQHRPQEGQRSSWQPHMIHVPSNASEIIRSVISSNNNHNITCNIKPHNGSIKTATSSDSLDELRHTRGHLNHSFVSSSNEIHQDTERPGSGSGPVSSSTLNGGSPKQPWSQSSSHCELVSSLGTAANCAGCLFACLRHSPNNTTSSNNSSEQQPHQPANCNHLHSNMIHEHLMCGTGTSDSSLVRQHQQATTETTTTTVSDIDKATLSSRDSNVDSCSSFYTTKRSRTTK